MKQHITELQIKELNEEQLLNLIKIMYNANPINFKVEHDIISYNRKGGATNRYYVHGLNLLSRKLTIGKMIEILENSVEHLAISKHNNVHIGYTIGNIYQEGKYNPIKIYTSPSWLIEKHTEKENEEYRKTVYCDSLFETLKEIL